MEFSLGLLATLICSSVLYASWKLLLLKRDARRPGFEPPVQLPCLDPFFGIDIFFKNFKMALQDRLLDALHERFRAMGDTYGLTSLGLPVIATTNLDNLKSVYWLNHQAWGIASFRAPMRELVGEGIITADGEGWKRSRELLKPSFAQANIEDFAPLEKIFQQFLHILPPDGQTVDFQPLVFTMYLDLACIFLFGEPIGAMSNLEDPKLVRFRDSFEKALLGTGLRITLGPLASLLPRAGWLHACKDVHSFVEPYVEAALNIALKADSTGPDLEDRPHVLLHRLALATKNREELRDQVLNALTASLDTTAVLISNCVFVLSRRKDLWRRLKSEVDNLKPEDLSFERLRSIKFLRSFINETLRMYTIFTRVSRSALHDTHLPTGGGLSGKSPIFVSRGTRLEAGFYDTHKDSRIWGEDVEEFRPERWAEKEVDAWHFVPFGVGAHACLGKQKSLMETSYILVRIAQEFDKIESRDERPWTARMQVTTRNRNGCKVAFFRT